MKSVWASGQETPLGSTRPQSPSQQTAGGDADLTLDRLHPDAVRCLPGIEKGQNPSSSIGRRVGQQNRADHADEGPLDQMADMRLGHEQHQQRHRAHDDRRAEFGLCDEQGRVGPDHDQDGPYRPLRPVHLQFSSAQERCRHQDQRQFGELGRLDHDRSECKPPARAVHIATDPGNEHDHEEESAERARRGRPDERRVGSSPCCRPRRRCRRESRICSCLENWKNGDESNLCTLDTDDADSTMTRPNKVSPMTRTVIDQPTRSPTSVAGSLAVGTGRHRSRRRWPEPARTRVRPAPLTAVRARPVLDVKRADVAVDLRSVAAGRDADRRTVRLLLVAGDLLAAGLAVAPALLVPTRVVAAVVLARFRPVAAFRAAFLVVAFFDAAFRAAFLVVAFLVAAFRAAFLVVAFLVAAFLGAALSGAVVALRALLVAAVVGAVVLRPVRRTFAGVGAAGLDVRFLVPDRPELDLLVERPGPRLGGGLSAGWTRRGGGTHRVLPPAIIWRSPPLRPNRRRTGRAPLR